MNRRLAVLSALSARPNQWVSGLTLVEAGSGWRYSARIYDLRLVAVEPVTPGQTTLFGTAA